VDEGWQALGRVLDECLAEPVWAKPDCLMVDEVDRLVVVARRVAAAALARVREVDGRGLAVGRVRPARWRGCGIGIGSRVGRRRGW